MFEEYYSERIKNTPSSFIREILKVTKIQKFPVKLESGNETKARKTPGENRRKLHILATNLYIYRKNVYLHF